jgi:hypothetical protein
LIAPGLAALVAHDPVVDDSANSSETSETTVAGSKTGHSHDAVNPDAVAGLAASPVAGPPLSEPATSTALPDSSPQAIPSYK